MEEEITMKIVKVEVQNRRRPKGSSYDNGRYKPATSLEYRAFNEPTRVYVSPTDYSVMENLVNRRNRPWKVWKPLVEKELRDAGVQGKVRWSQHAGCKMCPCSPGFVLESAIRDPETDAPVDVWITVDASQG